MQRRRFLVGGAIVGLGGCAVAATNVAHKTPVDAAEHAATIAALRPPKRARPVTAVLGSPHGAETTDLIVPYGVLRQSGLAEVHVVSPSLATMPLMPSLSVRPHMDFAGFDAAWPDGADYVIVPAMHRDNDPALLEWLVAQRNKGATICAICAGALVLSNAGLIGDRRATTHWYRVDELRRANPDMEWARDRRFVIDRGIATTTGISASLPFSLTLVEAIGGESTATALADSLGVRTWNATHNSDSFGLSSGIVWTAIRNRAAFWRQQRVGIPIDQGVDEVSLALVADVWSETYRSTAFAVSIGAVPVTTRNGLDIITTSASNVHHMIESRLDHTPTQALETALEDIATRYGRDTAQFAALNLEYSWR